VSEDESWSQTELCQWRIQATHGEKIVLNVTTLDLPDSVDCATSYVEVRDGPSIKSPLIGQSTVPVQLLPREALYGNARSCDCMSIVHRLSVRLSVTLVDCDHICWKA